VSEPPVSNCSLPTTYLAECRVHRETDQSRNAASASPSWLEAELWRLKGEALLTETASEAETAMQQGIAVARRQNAKSWELRGAMSLARLWAEQGRRSEARDLLAPVYAWFTEGFDTADLKEAKALLDELTEPAIAAEG